MKSVHQLGQLATMATEQALSRIAPLWPLSNFVAVNPFLGLLNLSFEESCLLLQRTTGHTPLLSILEYDDLFREGVITAEILASVADEAFPVAKLLALAERQSAAPEPSGLPFCSQSDVFITEEISKWCASYFDKSQALWSSPFHDAGLYAGWRAAALHDRSAEIVGIGDFRTIVAALPADAEATIAHYLDVSNVVPAMWADVLHRQLATVGGWASYAQYVDREKNARGGHSAELRDLLALRLAFSLALGEVAESGAVSAHMPALTAAECASIGARVRWQRAYEVGYQRSLARALTTGRTASVGRVQAPSAQVVFCIDVRSERLRRHLESQSGTVQTLGFAGFFGFAVEHQAVADDHVTVRCPALLVPPQRSTELASTDVVKDANEARARTGTWNAFQSAVASCFAVVENVGLAFALPLARLRDSKPAKWEKTSTPILAESEEPATVEVMANLAEGALRAMSLTAGFARLVVLCGHGSQSANNPHASSLDCGACGGHAGDVNARLAARALNHPQVRDRLAERGILLPESTWVVAALHNTMTDTVEFFDVSLVPASHQSDLAALQKSFAQASGSLRRERAESLGIESSNDAELRHTLRVRAGDVAQTRPEWGLANNAALIAAPRARTASLNLEGRVFLHDYREQDDAEGNILTSILTAPVVVASWINLQYYACRVDPAHFGAGSKVLHNVVAGLGVVEGNGGDLKVGLPLQSIHDGQAFRHEPRRLSVYIEAPRARLEAVLAAQPAIRQLVEHEWIHLFSLEGENCMHYARKNWVSVPAQTA